MRIKEVLTAGTLVPSYNNIYNSDDWFLATSSRMDSLLRRLHGNREIFDEYVEVTGTQENPAGTRQNLLEIVDSCFELNCYKYRHLWTLYEAQYNPLWNVDGTEVTERERKNTGTETHKKSGKEITTYSGTEDLTRSGNETWEPSGKEKLSKTGSTVEAHTGGEQNARTTFDSASFLDTDKMTDTKKIGTTYGKDASGNSDPYAEETSFTTRKDTTTYNNVKDSRSFTNRKDELEYNNTQDQRTDNLTETERITHTRGGNIGVTMTTQLERDEQSFVAGFRLIEDIIADIANSISFVW